MSEVSPAESTMCPLGCNYTQRSEKLQIFATALKQHSGSMRLFERNGVYGGVYAGVYVSVHGSVYGGVYAGVYVSVHGGVHASVHTGVYDSECGAGMSVSDTAVFLGFLNTSVSLPG